MSELLKKASVEKTKLIYSTGYLASVLLFFMGPMFLYVFKDNLSQAQAYNLIILLVLPPLFRLVISYFFTKNLENNNLIDSTWDHLYFWSTIVIGLSWGIAFYYLFPRVSDMNRLFIMMTCAGIVSAGCFLYAPKLKTSFGYVLANAIPVAVVNFMQHEQIYLILGFFTIFYTAIMIFATFVYNVRIHKMVTLRFQNEELIQELNSSNLDLKNRQKQMIHSSRLAAVGEMAGGVAHEINNPLTVILNYIRRLKKINSGDDKAIEYLTKIEVNSDRISTIIDSLKKFSLEDDSAEKKNCSLEVIINETLGLTSERLKNNGIRLVVDTPSVDSSIYANSIQISQVLLNIINNAMDAILEENDSPADKYIKLNILKNKSHVTIDVVNNGPKIPQKVLNNIFQPFFSTKDIGKGTGLGLSSSKGIIEDHGGSLEVKSTEDFTCFIIELPIVDEDNNEKSEIRFH